MPGNGGPGPLGSAIQGVLGAEKGFMRQAPLLLYSTILPDVTAMLAAYGQYAHRTGPSGTAEECQANEAAGTRKLGFADEDKQNR